ncbi:cupredoxin domain-containing protein [Candidatus Woesearchaeota archaeon]|nr:cupredoxin domain-containing protein [Candidatus Woesearchaeota archaeon]
MKKSINVIFALTLLLIAVVAVSGCSQYDGGNQAAQPPAPPALPQQPAAASEKTIEITATGFSPSPLTIKAGQTVTFVNKDTAQHWPASAVHPTHAVYPEPDGCIGSKFDACKGLAQGESFTFVFNEKGSWKYHDHLNCCSDPAFFGTIVVE